MRRRAVHLEQAYGHTISLHSYRLDADRVVQLLGVAGFTEVARLLRRPVPPEKVPQVHVVARRS